ncbi:MAG: hypothetical protein R3F51_02680 [Cyanobacteriota/Melainabacteria group bacterium]
MRTNENPLDIVPGPNFAPLHPALTALENAMGEQKEAVDIARRTAEWANREAADIEPTAWTSRIEAGSDDPAELGRLRMVYDEKALGFMSAYLAWQVARQGMMEGRSKISEAITDLLIAHDGIDDRSVELAYLKPIMKARLLKAAEWHRADVKDWPANEHNNPTIQLIDRILKGAFAALVTDLPGNLRKRPYTSDLVIKGKDYEPHLNPDVDLRRSSVVRFVDCVNSSHPASRRLAEILLSLPDAYRAAYRRAQYMKGTQNGQVNEAQHARRLVEHLHADQLPYHYGSSISDQIDAQETRRLDYECHRHLLTIDLRSFEALVLELVEALKASLEETSALLAEVEADSRATIDRLFTVKIMMNNCLAADLALRRYVRDLGDLKEVENRDMSHRAGRKALDDAFAEARKHYDFGVKRRLEAKN